MNKLITTTAVIALAATAATASARPSTETQIRGYNLCMDAAQSTSNGLVAAREYLVNKEDGVANYYINATRWENGQRAYVRVACSTVAHGNRLLSAAIEPGRYVESDGVVTIDVAAR